MCFNSIGIDIRKSVVDPLASAEILLSDDERRQEWY
jgi:cell division ATPase FtsA